MINGNVCEFAPKTEAEYKKQQWHRIDCLAAHQLKSAMDNAKLLKWFGQQDGEWQEARKERFMARVKSRYTSTISRYQNFG